MSGRNVIALYLSIFTNNVGHVGKRHFKSYQYCQVNLQINDGGFYFKIHTPLLSEPFLSINPLFFKDVNVLCIVLTVLDVLSASSSLVKVGFDSRRDSTASSVLFTRTFYRDIFSVPVNYKLKPVI